jgi:hypothetical protein
MEEKQTAEINCAKRSLVTNFICISVFIVCSTLVFVLPRNISNYYVVISFTFIKGLMPVLSTLANFGTVQSVFWQYKELFCQFRVVKMICGLLRVFK